LFSLFLVAAYSNAAIQKANPKCPKGRTSTTNDLKNSLSDLESLFGSLLKRHS
jgi:hypothetical protein